MRSRSHSIYGGSCDVSSSGTYYYSVTGASYVRKTPVYKASQITPYEESFEVADDLAPVSTRKTWNSFRHYKRRLYRSDDVAIPQASWFYLASSSFYDLFVSHDGFTGWDNASFGPKENPTVGLPQLLDLTVSDYIPNPSGLDALRAIAWKRMLPNIKSELSAINSLWELKDFKSLPKTISRIGSLASTLLKGKGTKRPLGRILGTTADAHLQYAFNIAPLLSDIAGIQRAIENVRKQVKQMLAYEQKVILRNYTANLSQYKPSTSTSGLSGLGTKITGRAAQSCGASSLFKVLGQVQQFRDISYPVARFHSQLEYSYYLTDFDRKYGEILGLLDALGVQLNPAIIWNAIPWSFVVDWVFGVNRWLDQFKTSNLNPIVHIRKGLWSVEVQRDIVLRLKYNCPPGPLGPTEVVAGKFIENSYKRVSTLDGVTAALTASGLSLNEFALGSSLVISRRYRR